MIVEREKSEFVLILKIFVKLVGENRYSYLLIFKK
jgi:hypothetical protein